MNSLAAMVSLSLALLAPSFPPSWAERVPARARVLAVAGLGGLEPLKLEAASSAKRPFTLFAPTRWRPGSPMPGEWQENLAYGLFVAAPLLSFGFLLVFVRRVKRSQAPSGWGRLVIGNILVFCCLATPILLAGETYFRFVYDTTDSLAYTRVSERWQLRHWRLNQAGCRDNVDYPPTLSPGQRRISFVGDSFTAGHGISNVDDRFPNLLRRAHPEWEVQVLAKVGLETGMELKLLQRAFARGYQVDQVVLVYCLNDIEDMMPAQTDAILRALAVIDSSPWIVRKSYMLNLFYHHYRAQRDPHLGNYCYYVRDAYSGPLWGKQQERLRAIRDLVQAHGGRLAVVTFPFLNALGPNYEYRFVHEKLDHCWRELGVPHLDLLTVYAGLPPGRLTVNRLDAHPNEYANQLAAAAIDKWLRGLLGQ